MYTFDDMILSFLSGCCVGILYQFIQMLPAISNEKSFVSTKNSIEPPKKPIFPKNTIR